METKSNGDEGVWPQANILYKNCVHFLLIAVFLKELRVYKPVYYHEKHFERRILRDFFVKGVFLFFNSFSISGIYCLIFMG